MNTKFFSHNHYSIFSLCSMSKPFTFRISRRTSYSSLLILTVIFIFHVIWITHFLLVTTASQWSPKLANHKLIYVIFLYYNGFYIYILRFLYDDMYCITLGVDRSFTNKNFVWCYLEERIEVLQSIWHYADSAPSLKKSLFYYEFS